MFRIRLRSFLVLFTAVGVGVGCYSSWSFEYQREQAAIKQLQNSTSRRFKVVRDSENPLTTKAPIML